MSDLVRRLRNYDRTTASHDMVEAADCIEELEGVIDRADAHTAMLMQAIANLETRLKAAEYAARTNYDGWQQEIARAALAPEQDQ